MSSAFDASAKTDDDDGSVYYTYDHATGRHVLTQRSGARQPPRYSLKCICCNLCDFLILIGCLALLYFAITYAFSLLEDYGDGGGNG